MPSPQERYAADMASGAFSPDAAQAEAVAALEELYQRLQHPADPSAVARVWRRWRGRAEQPETGLYFWGGVGRGKTYLMDAFYESLPGTNKLRVHFHRFMQRVHREMTALEGQKDPLDTIAERLAAEARVICFDEFFVTDIADAMILGNLMEGVFRRGVTLVATSNIEPDRLYENGLQRQRFLPVIDLLYRHTRVMNVDGGVDYRLRALQRAELYHYPLDDSAEVSLRQSFQSLAPGEPVVDEVLEVNGRALQSRMRSDDVVWFDFAELCEGPRSGNDYIELAREYHAVIVGGVPALGSANDDAARRFINLVDEFYDRNVKLVLSAARPVDELYGDGRLGFEFQRTRSRLQEMQSQEYLAREHRP